MKRGAPPKRSAPLKRASTPLPRSAMPVREGQLRARSEKRQRLYDDERIPLVRRLLRDRPYCQAQLRVCSLRSTDVHEIKSRARGGSIVDEANLLCVCRPCHDYITEHASDPVVVALGLSAPSWS